jgi:catechol 2,3-dioxygenase-like lactoylglutathione lyase family enzyme
MNEITGVAQIALSVRDLARATTFYRDGLGLKHLFEVPGLSFFDVGGVRLMISASDGEPGGTATMVYLRVADLEAAHAALLARGVAFKQAPHVVGRTPDKEVSLAFCLDPDGNMIGLMSERALQ